MTRWSINNINLILSVLLLGHTRDIQGLLLALFSWITSSSALETKWDAMQKKCLTHYNYSLIFTVLEARKYRPGSLVSDEGWFSLCLCGWYGQVSFRVFYKDINPIHEASTLYFKYFTCKHHQIRGWRDSIVSRALDLHRADLVSSLTPYLTFQSCQEWSPRTKLGENPEHLWVCPPKLRYHQIRN